MKVVVSWLLEGGLSQCNYTQKVTGSNPATASSSQFSREEGLLVCSAVQTAARDLCLLVATTFMLTNKALCVLESMWCASMWYFHVYMPKLSS